MPYQWFRMLKVSAGMKTARPGCRGGYTLFELILSMTLMVLGVVAVVSVMLTGMAADRAVESRSVAAMLAQGRMEEVRSTAFSSVASVARAAVSGYPDYDIETIVSGTNPKQVTVRVYWTHKGANLQMDLVTLCTNLTP